MSILDGLKGLVGGLAKIANVLAPICALIPGLQWVTIAAMALNAANGLMQKPPDFSAIISAVLSQALPLGLGKSLDAFKALGGGTAGKFAELLTGNVSQVLKQVAGHPSLAGNSVFSSLIDTATKKLGDKGFQDVVGQLINTLTGTGRNDILSAEQIGGVLTRTDPQTGQATVISKLLNVFGGLGEQVGSDYERQLSTWAESVGRTPVDMTGVPNQPVVESTPEREQLSAEAQAEIRRTPKA